MAGTFRASGEAGPGFAYGGVCCLSKDLAEGLSGGAVFLEQDLFPQLAEAGRLAAGVYPGLFVGLSDPEALDRAGDALAGWKRRPALFLDRDGVLNVNYGYVHTRDKWTWCPGARKAVKFANDAGLLVILVTNQSGIGRGYYGEDAFHELMAWVREDLAGVGAHLDGVYHCPHHPTEAVGDFRRECACRKPGPGMLLQALDEWDIDVARSAVIGDSDKDIEAGRHAGISRLRLYDHERESLLDVVRDVFSFLSDE
ncbi:MAG: D-glycero-beta-D-manno-heptose 1,7-bisphosphate 7-phosphatase [Desulfovibrionaceae bacterium]|nr:D-glycero-beta-D-manno-heptose 1,7-bisphosphate 7-phosphatase [Desulfovibrionaceae bacterium]